MEGLIGFRVVQTGIMKLPKESVLVVISQRANYSIMVYFSNCLTMEHNGFSSLMESINTNYVYMDTNYWNKSQIRFKMLHVNTSFREF